MEESVNNGEECIFNYDILEQDFEGRLPGHPKYEGDKSSFMLIVKDEDDFLRKV